MLPSTNNWNVDRPTFIAIGFLGIIYSVGIVGLSYLPTRALFQALTPWNIVLSVVLIVAFHQDKSSTFFKWMAFVACLGYVLEIIGVQTGILFGAYQYGATLGWKIWGVPPLIGLNWFLLTYSAGVICANIKVHQYVQISLGAALMVGLDYLIEPVAVALDFWEWGQKEIPLQNYIAWYFISWLMIWTFIYVVPHKNNRVAAAIYVIQVGFFLILNILLFIV